MPPKARPGAASRAATEPTSLGRAGPPPGARARPGDARPVSLSGQCQSLVSTVCVTVDRYIYQVPGIYLYIAHHSHGPGIYHYYKLSRVTKFQMSESLAA